MKRSFFISIFAVFALISTAQTITYDTIRVSVDDNRNIHKGTQKKKVDGTSKGAGTYVNRPNKVSTPKSMVKTKVRYGANLGISFSRNYSSINIGPQIGYQATDWAMIGGGVKYNYNKIRRNRSSGAQLYKNHLIGASAFGYLYPVRFVTLFVQPEINYLWSNNTTNDGSVVKTSGSVPSFVVGGGLRFGGSHITLNYDVVQHRNSPYSRGVFLGIAVFM